MTEAIHAIARQISSQLEALSVIGQNVANLGTPGFRASRAVPDFAGSAGLSRALPELREGPLRQTGRGLDLALRGEGYFVVGQGDGLVLTRNGAFQRSAEGWLVDAQGRPVLGPEGMIRVDSDRLTVGSDGQILDAGRPVARLLLLAPARDARLDPAAGGFLLRGDAVEAAARVVQGALEGSNVDPTRESVALVTTTRHIESMQRALAIYDRALDTGINQLGNR